ncbi:nodulation protein NfeD [Microbulbifer sp. CAU 1566]|uniref:NfeD family protein n=1 Tax=Microbulbifer sp. CAU 1566 TaxID=2933269 RepID=UPI002003D325|nr:nodulation protein NfeD [Microbulbifer sp. CAU 1566]MCK7598232.1 nodulation protein NfeD [Microbulbifer sp. CAU 1566]
MLKWWSKELIACLLAVVAQLISISISAQESESAERKPHIAQLSINGPIGPATTDYLTRTSDKARELGAQLIIINMDTPGGLDAATRDIIQHILASDVPYVTYVTPAGARAASAGTYILYASHVAAMTTSTTLGAATPVQIGGVPGQQEPQKEPDRTADNSPEKQPETKSDKAPEDTGQTGSAEKASAPESEGQGGTAMERKVINDSVAYIRGLANRHKRNADWAEKAVRDAATLTAKEALAENVVDVVADNQQQLLAQLAGREVVMSSGKQRIAAETTTLPVVTYAPDWRNEILSLITNPQVAYILLLIGIYGLIFEGYSPGAIVPGVVGVICLLLAFYALQVLPINYAGLALIIVGALLIAAELFVPSFGALGIGGVIALIIGSVMLIDSDVPGMQVSRGLIGAIGGISALALLGVLYAVGRSLRKPKIAANQAMVGRTAVVTEVEPELLVKIGGEIWRARCDNLLVEGQLTTVVAEHGLLLQVAPE